MKFLVWFYSFTVNGCREKLITYCSVRTSPQHFFLATVWFPYKSNTNLSCYILSACIPDCFSFYYNVYSLLTESFTSGAQFMIFYVWIYLLYAVRGLLLSAAPPKLQKSTADPRLARKFKYVIHVHTDKVAEPQSDSMSPSS